jgi:hypothetical protein
VRTSALRIAGPSSVTVELHRLPTLWTVTILCNIANALRGTRVEARYGTPERALHDSYRTRLQVEEAVGCAVYDVRGKDSLPPMGLTRLKGR